MNTCEMATIITMQKLQEHVDMLDGRIAVATADMIRRSHRLGAEPVCPSDMDTVPLPDLPDLPSPVIEVAKTMNLNFKPSTGSLSRTARDRDKVRLQLSDKATPMMLLAAINALSMYVVIVERMAQAYSVATKDAVDAHLCRQSDAMAALGAIIYPGLPLNELFVKSCHQPKSASN